MDVKEAVKAAKAYAADIFERERPQLEEVWYDDEEHQWCVTIGLQRSEPNADPLLRPRPSTRMHYKTIRIDDNSGKIISLLNHDQMPVAPG